MPLTRLESDPDLNNIGRKLKKLDECRLREIVTVVCDYAYRNIPLDKQRLAKDVVNALKNKDEIGKDTMTSLKMIAERSDEEYFDLLDREGNLNEKCLDAFRTARILSGIAFALESDPLKAAQEAIYEILVGLQNDKELILKIEQMILQK